MLWALRLALMGFSGANNTRPCPADDGADQYPEVARADCQSRTAGLADTPQRDAARTPPALGFAKRIKSPEIVRFRKGPSCHPGGTVCDTAGPVCLLLRFS